MGFKKYQSVEQTEVVSEEGHKKIASTLSKTGSHSVAELTDEERQALVDQLPADE